MCVCVCVCVCVSGGGAIHQESVPSGVINVFDPSVHQHTEC